MKKHVISVVVVCICFFIASCGQKEVRAPSKRTVGVPVGTVGQKGKIPPTQRPYKINGRTYYPLPSSHGYSKTGRASWYGKDFHGKKTSNGETYNMYGPTAAHKTLPMNTHLLVRNLENGKEMVVRVNDRGPFVKGRIIDMTLAGARKIGFADKGTARVRITALGEAATFRQGNRTVERFVGHPDFTKGEFFVQIGSFEDRENAIRLKEKMRGLGKEALILSYDRGDRKFYRVRLRAGSTLSAAEHLEKVLNVSDFPDAFVVAR